MGMLPGRLTKERDGKQWVFRLEDGVEITPGTMVGLNASGLAVPAAAPTAGGVGPVVVGIAESTLDVNGLPHVLARRGCFAFDAAQAGAPTVADVGKPVYVADDHTVTTTASTGSGSTLVTYSQAGILLGVDDDGCWVKI